ncbi:hypothetical protein CF327_g318 [Tilletia walkeri]|nr:hypothetical protein CF327_g318 [Tilletia walkeri]
MLLAPSLVRLSVYKNKFVSPVARVRRVAGTVMSGPRPSSILNPVAAGAARTPFVSSQIPPPAHRGVKLDVRDGALVWIDCEMTGLTDQDRIIEIACIVTDGDLQPVDEGIQYVIQTPKEVLDAMGSWCVSLYVSLHSYTALILNVSDLRYSCDHASYRQKFMANLVRPWKLHWLCFGSVELISSLLGLTALCQNPAVAKPHDHVRAAVFAYVLDRVPGKNHACLAGNSVHADKVFLDREMPELTEHLSYRIVDVSSIKELVARWYGKQAVLSKASEHRALSDIKGSIEELKHYKLRYFRASGK